MKTIVECVPNFSEGRDAAKIEAIVEAIRSVPGVAILDCQMDADHNRSVVTFAGPVETIGEAAFRGIEKAVDLIDLRRHTGVHPRVGVADVVPFVPVEGVTLEDCVHLAENLGARLWERLRLPVYLYEAAARRPANVNLENIRRGQFEGLRDEVRTNPDRCPDFGGAELHPSAGAAVVGARKFLIAFNVNLATPDVEIARRIARAVRFSSGGFRYVKAIGVPLASRSLTQVSMNLTAFEQTPVHRVFEAVRAEAARYGTTIAGSQIVGLIPKKAMELTTEWALQIEDFRPGLVLENRLAAAAPSEGLAEFLDGLSSTAAAAAAAAMAAALGAKVAAMAGVPAGPFLDAKRRLLGLKWRDLDAYEPLKGTFVQLKEALEALAASAPGHAAEVATALALADAAVTSSQRP